MKKLILTIMGVVSILLSFNVNAKMSEGDDTAVTIACLHTIV
jgi:hypothetical protein